jgi:enoyl-CoA hydratase
MKEFEDLKIEIQDQIAVVYMNRPPVNALSVAFLLNIKAALQELAKDPELRCVILASANPKGWCAGGDVKDCGGSLPQGANCPVGQMIMNAIEQCPLPVIAAINGYCLGGGLEMSLACDIRIVADNVKIGMPEPDLCLILAWGGMTRLPWLIGEGNAKKLFFTAERISGEKAVELGIAQACVPADKLMDEAMAFAKIVAEKAPASIRGCKHVMYEMRRSILSSGLLAEAEATTALQKTPEDRREAFRAFTEKRAPVFKNK